MPLLDVQRLQTHFGTIDGVARAVEGLSFHIDAGETVAIVGESGCGKSVTSMSILRLIPEPPGRIAGKILFEGRDLLTLSDAQMRGIRGKEISDDLSGADDEPEPGAHTIGRPDRLRRSRTPPGDVNDAGRAAYEIAEQSLTLT